MESRDGRMIDLDNLWDHVHALKRIKFAGFFACCQHAGRDPAWVHQFFPMASPVERVFGSQVFPLCLQTGGRHVRMYDAPTDESKHLTEYIACLIRILCNGSLVREVALYLQEKVNQKTLWLQHPAQ